MANRPHPARHALATGLVAEELGDASHGVDHVVVLVEHHDHAGSQRSAGRSGVFERQGHVERFRADEAARRSPQHDGPQHTAVGQPAGQIDQVTQRGAELHLVGAGPDHPPAEAEQLGARGALGTVGCVGLTAHEYHGQDVDERLHVVDGRRLTEQPVGRREWRLVTGLAPEPLDGVEQGRLLATDVGTGPVPEVQVETGARAGHVGTQQPSRVGLGDGVGEAFGGHRVLAAYVQPALLCSDGQASHRHGLDQGKRVTLHDHAVLEGSRLGLICVAHQMTGATFLIGHATPLHSGGERRAAAPRETRCRDLGNHLVAAHGQRCLQRLVATMGPVVLEAGRVNHPDPGQKP